jgi:eukaryotic-like serine/threonine-protein kinase
MLACLMIRSEPASVIRFGVFEVEPRSGELRKQGIRVRLRDQSFQILLLLLERPGQVVTRDELQRLLWPGDSFVDLDGGLNKAVNRLREVLGDSADSPRFIETLPKRGYRFIAPVDGVAAARLEPSTMTPGGATRSIPEQTLSSALTDEQPRIRRTWIAGAAIVIIAAAATASYVRVTRRSPLSTEPALVVLADFDNHTGDAAFDDTLKQALAIDLEQSPVVRVVSDDEVMRTLRLMHRRPDERLTSDLTRDVCRRVNGQAVLAGSLALLSSEFVLGLNAIDCQTGEALARKQVRASRKEDVLAALDDASEDLRRKLGESAESMQRFDKRIHEMLTTSSLDAFQAYTSAERNVLTKGGWSAVPFFQRAIDLDPDFGYAHAAIGLVLGKMGETVRSTAHTERAYQLRDRVSEWERFFISVQYYDRVTGQLEKIPALSELWIQAYPHERTAHTRLAGIYGELGQHARALPELEQARRLGHEHPIDLDDWAMTAMRLDRVPEAATLMRQALERYPDRLGFRRDLHRASFLSGDAKEMAAQVEWAMRAPGADALFVDQSDADAYVGRFDKARSWLQPAIAAAARSDFQGNAAVWSAVDGLRQAFVGNAEEARRQTRTALEFEDSWETRALAAMTLARVGDVARARESADTLNAERPLATLIQNYWLPAIRAEIELHSGSASRAVERLRAAEPYELAADTRVPLLPAYVRGDAYLQMRDGRAAAAEFQKLLQHRGLVGNCVLGSLAHLGLARAFLLAGDALKARVEFESFFRVWAGADSNIPVLIQARAEYRAIRT